MYLGWRSRGSAREAPRGPWHLGRFGSAINLIAILWVAFITVILSVPDNMRAGRTIAIVTAMLAAWYVLGERHRFVGPAWTAQHAGATPHSIERS